METGISFDNTRKAFSMKDDNELRRSLWLFRLMHRPRFVKIGAQLTLFALRLHLPVRRLIRNTIFPQFCAGETLQESFPVVRGLSGRHVGAILDYSVEGKGRDEDFERTCKELLRVMEAAWKNPAIPYTSLKMTGLVRKELLEKVSADQPLSREEQKEYADAVSRLQLICRQAMLLSVPVYIDAEESWIQPAIDLLCENMMWRFNGQKAIVNTTLQMYRHDRLAYLEKLLQTAAEKKCMIGVKLVRGAYLEKENRRAAEQGYPSPIHHDKAATDRDFDAAVDLCLANIDRVTLCAGTHNEASTMHLIEQMKKLQLPNDHPHVFCSQLYGMSDHISFNLADAGYNVTKYLPYGPVDSVMPYLIRRAEENSAIAGQMGRELKLLLTEKERRRHALVTT